MIDKAAGALGRYGVHLVVANLLATRKDKVLLVTLGGAGAAGAAEVQTQAIDRPPGDANIERLLVEEVARAHRAHIGE